MKGESVWSGIVSLISLISLFVAVLSYNRSKEANKIANEALSNSKSNFIIEQRPRIILTPQRFKDNNNFVKISNTDDTITFKCQFEIKNVGNIPAKNISLPKTFTTIINSPTNTPISLSLPPPITLAANEPYHLTFAATLKLTKSGIEDILKKWESPDENMALQVTCFYSSELDRSVIYKTTKAVRLYKNQVELLASEME